MELNLELVEPKPIEVMVEGVSLTFQPWSKQDIVYAFNLLSIVSVTPVTKDDSIRHVFSKLTGLSGAEVKAGGEVLTVDRLQKICLQIKGKWTLAVCSAWAVKVAEHEGYFEREAEAKNGVTSSSDGSAQSSDSQNSTAETATSS